MKKFTALLLSTLLVFTLSACGASEKVQEKAAEKAIEKAIGGDVKVDIDGDKYTYEDKDGNKMEFGSTQWPTDEAAAFIPKFGKGTITACAIMSNMYIIDIETVSQNDYDSYLQAVKDSGFTEGALTLDGEGYCQYQGGDTNKNYMMLSYEPEIKKLQIVGTAAVKE